MSVERAKAKLGNELYHILRKEQNLPLKYILLVAEYVTNGMVKTQAYLDSVARKNTKKETAETEASLIFARPEIQKAVGFIVQHYLGELKLKMEKEIIDLHYHRAFYDPFLFITPTGEFKYKDEAEMREEVPKEWWCVVDGVEKKYYGRDADQEVIVFKLANRDKAAQELAKYIELYKENVKHELYMTEETENRLKSIFRGKRKSKKPPTKKEET